MATATKHGVTLPCPHCGALPTDEDHGLSLALGTLTLYCPSCSETVSRRDLERLRGEADRLLRLLDAAEGV